MPKKNPFATLPAIHVVLEHNWDSTEPLPQWSRLEGARQAVEAARKGIVSGNDCPSLEHIRAKALKVAKALVSPNLRTVVNATGVVLHTNLGRAPLGKRAIERINAVAKGYCNLEYDLESGRRGSRRVHVQDALCRLTGAEAALVLNNNAAAVFLVVTALSFGKDVVISRGELIEIGGSFRVPDILQAGGAILKEVGTTNRTHLADFENALGDNTGLLLKVHPSNFHMDGFTKSVPRGDLVSLGKEKGIPVVEDLGSGVIRGGGQEPSLREVLSEGLDLITLSGDKLLGGPQAGIILGKKSMVERLKKHPLARALRVGKLTLAALEGTLHSYLEEREKKEVPVIQALSFSEETLKIRAHRLMQRLHDTIPGLTHYFDVSCIPGSGRSGGGSLPGEELPTTLVSLKPKNGNESRWEKELREASPPVICRVQNGALLFDTRTLQLGDEGRICDALIGASR